MIVAHTTHQKQRQETSGNTMRESSPRHHHTSIDNVEDWLSPPVVERRHRNVSKVICYRARVEVIVETPQSL